MKYSFMLLVLIETLLFGFTSCNLKSEKLKKSEIVSIPDSTFKQYLLSRTDSINTVDDGEISIKEALAFKGHINLYNYRIKSLEGLESFKNLTGLSANVDIKKLNISKNKELKTLYLFLILENIDLSNNLKLEYLNIQTPESGYLDVSKNTELTYLSCYDASGGIHPLTNLDVSKNIKLQLLECNHNNLSSIDISNNTELVDFNCSENSITNINTDKNLKLKHFACANNSLNSLNVNNNLELVSLSCDNNSISNLNIYNNKFLEVLDCQHNFLNNLDVSRNLRLRILNCFSNKNLVCIGAYNYQNKDGWIKDRFTIWSENHINVD